MKKPFWFLIFLALCGCLGVALPPVSPLQVERAIKQWPDMNQEKLESARRLYVEKCSACHNLRLPAEFPLEKWRTTLDKMAEKAKLTNLEKELIWKYVVTAQ